MSKVVSMSLCVIDLAYWSLRHIYSSHADEVPVVTTEFFTLGLMGGVS